MVLLRDLSLPPGGLALLQAQGIDRLTHVWGLQAGQVTIGPSFSVPSCPVWLAKGERSQGVSSVVCMAHPTAEAVQAAGTPFPAVNTSSASAPQLRASLGAHLPQDLW